MASSDSSVHQTIEKTLRGFLMGYQDAKEQNDPSQISRHLAPDCKRYISPASFLKGLGAPPDMAMDNQAYQDRFASELPVQGVKQTDIADVVIDAKARTAATRAVYHGEYSDGEKLSLEFAWFLKFSDDGTQVVQIREWIDTQESGKFHAKVQSLLEQLKAKQ